MKADRPRKTWVFTDPHFLHDNTIKYCKRPLDFNVRLWKGLNQVPDDDILICIGDVACNRLELEAHDRFIKPLKCLKVLIRGNHDKKSDNFYMNNGWDIVCLAFRNFYFGKNVLFTHHPKQWDGSYDYNIHGHFHNIDSINWEPELVVNITDKHILLSCESMNYQVANMDWLISKAKSRDNLMEKFQGNNNLVYKEFKNQFKNNRGCFYFDKDKIIGENTRVDIREIW